MGYHLKTPDCEAGCTSKTAYPRFTDCEAGLRFLTPGTGRWNSRDPIGEWGGINLAGFAGNDCVNWVDVVGAFTRKDTPCQIAIFVGHKDNALSFTKGHDNEWDLYEDALQERKETSQKQGKNAQPKGQPLK